MRLHQQLFGGCFKFGSLIERTDSHARGKPLRQYSRYTCQHCDEFLDITAETEDSYRAMRFAQHLRRCKGHHGTCPSSRWSCKAVPTPPRQRSLPSIWPLLPGVAPAPLAAAAPHRKRRKRASVLERRLRRERHARTLVYKWIDAYAHKID